jgi:crotonobetainyl-CoA:carnitine CoA-transferase CaiB-like acyl-CoA transferase
LTGELACYRIYETADGRHLTVAALEPRFWQRLVELVGRPELAPRAADAHCELEELFASRPLAHWLDLFDGEDVAAGPVRTLGEAGLPEPDGRGPALGEHTEAWRRELGVEAV